MNPGSPVRPTGPDDIDLHLYLAGALPVRKRWILAIARRLDPALAERLAALEAENRAYRRKEKDRLRGILFPHSPGHRAYRDGTRSPRRAFTAWWPPALAGAACVLALVAIPRPGLHGVLDLDRLSSEAIGNPEAIAKGRAIGVNLFVKGDSAYRVTNQTARVAATDTLQVIPIGSEAQHLVLLGWDARRGLVRLFPREGDRSRSISRTDLPPALLLQDMDDNRLICATATSPFTVAEVESLLRSELFRPLEKAPASHLGHGLYLQIFSIAKSTGRI
ncbi:MAG TPA: hypothetical protein VJ385_11775 [Fibrobacteria bacterium]|nr:hypothetical protein [Fibrobacteria bacterium]